MRNLQSRAAAPTHDDEFASQDSPEVFDSLELDPAGEGPETRVCLSCGASPSAPGDCPHEEVVTLSAPPPAVRVCVERLKQSWAQHRQLARALRRAVEAEIVRGRGEHSPRALPRPVALPQPAT